MVAWFSSLAGLHFWQVNHTNLHIASFSTNQVDLVVHMLWGMCPVLTSQDAYRRSSAFSLIEMGCLVVSTQYYFHPLYCLEYYMLYLYPKKFQGIERHTHYCKTICSNHYNYARRTLHRSLTSFGYNYFSHHYIHYSSNNGNMNQSQQVLFVRHIQRLETRSKSFLDQNRNIYHAHYFFAVCSVVLIKWSTKWISRNLNTYPYRAYIENLRSHNK